MSITELDDLKTAWQTVNQNLERQNALALHQFKENKLSRFRSGLRPLVLGQLVQLVIGVAIIAASAQFWVTHLSTPHLLICGVLLQGYGVMFVAFAVRDLLLIRGIDYAAPVVEIQKRLAELRAWHLRAAAWHGLTGSVVWLPVMIVLLHALGAKAWIDKPSKIVWLISTAVVCLALNYGLMRLARSTGRCGQALRRSWIGSTVNRAQATLDEIAQFEKE
ncbi:MAG TPA: hypothetical protein VH188_13785 [Chthoniobacterales bacterium]|jgi:hypothetical protein|nr:hypothetical protein [Chthoniobacterales bacterium]